MEPFTRTGAGTGDDADGGLNSDWIEYRRLTFDGDECSDGLDWRVVNWANGSAKTLPGYAIKVVVMKTMGWDHWTYRAQPQFVIDQVLMFLSSEAQGLKMSETK